MPNLIAHDVRAFIPAKNFAESKAFYAVLGWNIEWEDANLAVMELAGRRFYLQNYYQKEFAENCMLHISVEDAQAWYEHVRSLVDTQQFETVRVEPPKRESDGALVTYLWDPCGVLLHLMQSNDA